MTAENPNGTPEVPNTADGSTAEENANTEQSSVIGSELAKEEEELRNIDPNKDYPSVIREAGPIETGEEDGDPPELGEGGSESD